MLKGELHNPDHPATKADLAEALASTKRESIGGLDSMLVTSATVAKRRSKERRKDRCGTRLARVLILRMLRKANHCVPEETQAFSAGQEGRAPQSQNTR